MICVVTRQPAGCLGGEAFYVRMIADIEKVFVISTIKPGSRIKYTRPTLKELYFEAQGSIPKHFLQNVRNILNYECDIVMINDVCGIHRELLDIALGVKLSKILVIHEGNAHQCSALEYAMDRVDRILVFDEEYERHIVPKYYRDKVILLKPPVPILKEIRSVKRNNDIKSITVLVRGADWNFYEGEIVKLDSVAHRYDLDYVYVHGAYSRCINLVKRYNLKKIKCLPISSPSEAAQKIGETDAVYVFRRSTTSLKILFPTQVLETFNPSTPVISAKIDFVVMTRVFRDIIIADMIDNCFVLRAHDVEQHIRNRLRRLLSTASWMEKTMRYYEENNIKRWLENLRTYVEEPRAIRV